MRKTIEFLNPSNRLVEETADWLARRANTDAAGAASLAHICVVVPTAQSGRNLRLALAKRFPNGLIPPMVIQPMRLVSPADESMREATDAEVAALFLKFTETRPKRRVENGNVVELNEWTHLFRPEALEDPDSLFSFLDQLSDIWNILGAGGKLMREVRENEAAQKVLAGAAGDEAVRWDELAELEEAFFEFLHEHALRHRAESIHLAKTAPKTLPEEIREVALPALADPVPVLYDVLENQSDGLEVTVLLHCGKSDQGKFDEWGRPRIECWTGDNRPKLRRLTDNDIVRAASDGKLAARIADDFPEANSEKEIPSIGLCDENLFPELAGAFLKKEYEIHDPARYRLSASSLGRIAERLIALYDCGAAPWPWDDFVALLREYDVLRRLTSCKQDIGAEEGSTQAADASSGDGDGEKPARTDVLRGLDIYRNAAFPSVVQQSGNLPMDCFDSSDEHGKSDVEYAKRFARAAQGLADLVRDAKDSSGNAALFLRAALADIYRNVCLGAWKDMDAADGEPVMQEGNLEREREDAEFSAAIEAILGVLSQFDDETIRDSGLTDSLLTALLRKGLAKAVYSLEPDSDKVLMTEGWLELAWSAKSRIALAGFNEGSVPETVTGHVFLPDLLRVALGLPSNDSRLARDTFLLQSIVAARGDHCVRAYFSRTNNEGDIYRPSRLLFLVDDADLPRRVETLFGALPADERRPAREVAKDWRPRLPLEMPSLPRRDEKTARGRLSSSSIDDWLACPFAFLLKDVLKMERLQEKDEFGADDFGTLVHAALEKYALEQLERTARGQPQFSDERDIRGSLLQIIQGLRESYGKSPSLKIRIQLDSLETRLENFAKIQAFWAGLSENGGWRIVAKPELDFLVRPFAGEGDALLEDVWIKGKVDRVDYKEGVGYRLIDYKTWDVKSKAVKHVLSSGEDEASHARALALPLVPPARKNLAERRFLTTQLPLYARCLEKAGAGDLGEFAGPLPVPFAGNVVDYCYVVLGKTEAETVVFGSNCDQCDFEAQQRGKFVLVEHAGKALDTARVAIRRIRQGIFWPPGPGSSLEYDLKDILLDSPEKDLKGSDWVREQERRLAEALPAVMKEEGTEVAQ